jgi:hypothetical protein
MLHTRQPNRLLHLTGGACRFSRLAATVPRRQVSKVFGKKRALGW